MGLTDYAGRATAYASAVVSGPILASKWIKLAAERHLRDLARASVERNARWVYSPQHAHHVCDFAEKCRHEKGSKQGQRIVLEDAQVFILANLFGWLDRENGLRKYREALIMLPRGSGKSPLAAWIGLYMAFFAGEKGAEVFCGANKLNQAMHVFRPAKAYIEQEPNFGSRFGIKFSQKSIYQLATRSRFIPVVRAPGDGDSIWCFILDEFHEAKGPELYDVFKTGAQKRPGSLGVVISTAGLASFDNPCYALQEEGQKVLEGTLENERWLVIIHCADDSVDWTKPEALEMAQPMLGISNDKEALLEEQRQAVQNSAKANVFRAKHLNQWPGATTGWMSMVEWNACADKGLVEDNVKGLPCWIGSDLASKIDLSACIRLYRDDSKGDKPHYYALTRTYIPQARVDLPHNQHYQRWVKEGYLTPTRGSSIDYALLEADAIRDIAYNQVHELCYDARYADQWSQRIEEAAGIIRVEVPPSPTMLSPAMKELEAAIYDRRFHHDGHKVLTWCMNNVLTRETAAGNYSMPDKPKPEAKIDAAVALFIAMVRAMLSVPKPQSVYEKRGVLVL